MSLPITRKYQYRPVDSSDEDIDGESTVSRPDFEFIWRRRFYILLVCSLSFISILITGFVYRLNIIVPSSSPNPGVKIPYSPAPVTYVNKWLKGDPETPKFVGQPRPEMDHAWHDLLSATAIRLSEEELTLASNATSIRHKDGGYVGGLGISHSLHCVLATTPFCFPGVNLTIFTDSMRKKRIKQYMHPEYYYHGEQAWEELFSHADHCLESLRQAVMCSADVSVYTLKWTPHNRYKPAVVVPQPHACVDWEALHGWMSGRPASLDDIVGPPESLYEGIETSPNHADN